MMTVEGFGDGLFDGAVLGIIDHHADPRDGLEQRPVKTERQHQRHDHTPFGNPP